VLVYVRTLEVQGTLGCYGKRWSVATLEGVGTRIGGRHPLGDSLHDHENARRKNSTLGTIFTPRSSGKCII